jgi:hypothetical protein
MSAKMQRRTRARFEELYWHDGIFERLTVIAPLSRKAKGEVALDISLYPLKLDVPFPSSHGPKRVPLRVTFGGVRSMSMNCDMPDLASNHVFGNTDRGWIRELQDGRRFILAMFGGELTINYKKVQVERR